MSQPVPTQAEIDLAQMVVIWSHGEAAQHDPMIINLLARHAVGLNCLAPGAVEKVRFAFQDMRERSACPHPRDWPAVMTPEDDNTLFWQTSGSIPNSHFPLGFHHFPLITLPGRGNSNADGRR